MKQFAIPLVAVAAMAVTTSAAIAHTAWFERDGQAPVWRLMFGGHHGVTEPATPSRLMEVTAVDARGRPLRTTRTVSGADVRIAVAGQPVMLTLHYDNGMHSRTGTGPSVELPMDQVPGATSATTNQKYAKTIVTWGSSVLTRPVGQPLEVIPLSSRQPRAGQPMRVQVRLNGRPVAGARLGRGEDPAEAPASDTGATTDANGIASFTPTAGFNRLWAGQRIPVTGNPHYTVLSYEYSFGFMAQ